MKETMTETSNLQFIQSGKKCRRLKALFWTKVNEFTSRVDTWTVLELFSGEVFSNL